MASTDPRTATQGQWENLADRVQSKAEIGSVLSTPSNVAYVGTNNIVDAAVTTAKISNESVTTAKISDGAVTTAKISDGAVTTAKISDGVVTADKINFNTYGAFSRYISGSQSYTAWTGGVAQFNSKDFDDVGCSYDSSTYKVTISQPGIWLFITTINTPSGNGEYGTAAIRNSNTTIASNRTISSGSQPSSICVSLITKVNAGDKIDVFVAGSANQTNSARAAQNFSGICILPNL